MTEDEAKTKWCPQARSGSGQSGLGSMNRDAFPAPEEPYIIERHTRCLASACMFWRWSEPKRTAAFLEAVQAKMQTQDKPNFNTATQAVYAETGGKFERVEGFCGIAGQPS